jgi:hypothetical protein
MSPANGQVEVGFFNRLIETRPTVSRSVRRCYRGGLEGTMAGIPKSGVADKIREIDGQESHGKSDTMASNHNSGAEEKIRDVRDQESNSMSDWGKSDRIRKIERLLVIYGGQKECQAEHKEDQAEHKEGPAEHKEGQAEQNGGRAQQNGGQSEHNGGQAEQNGGRAQQNEGQSEQNGGQGKVLIMKLTACRRKPDEQYTPEQWQFGLHNRNVQASTTVTSYPESEGMKLRLAAACNLKPFTWDTFCAHVVDKPEKTMISYGLDHRVTIFNRKEVQYLLTLDALTLLLVLTRHVLGSSELVNILAKDTKAMDSLLLPKMPSSNMPPSNMPLESSSMPSSYMPPSTMPLESSNMPLEPSNMSFIGLSDDLFLLENQVPMALLTKVMNKCSEILNDQKKPFSPQKLLDSSLKAIAKQMCLSVFTGPTIDKEELEASIEAKFPVGELEKCAHIFSCAYRILCTPTTSVVKQPGSASFYQQLLAMFGFDSQNATKSHLVCATNSGAHQKPDNPSERSPDERLIDISSTSKTGEHEEHQDHILKSATKLKKAGIRFKACRGTRRKREGHEEHQDNIFKSATKLKKAGIPIIACCGMLDKVDFEDGCLYLPIVILEDRTESYFRNLTMYEMFDETDLLWRGGDRPFTNYIQLMGQLIKKKEDVEHLIDKGVIVNGLVTIENAFDMWNKLQKGLPNTPYSKCYQHIVSEVNEKCKSTVSVVRTEFYELFCSRPWLVIGALTAIVVTLATLVQIYTAIIGSDRMLPRFPSGG